MKTLWSVCHEPQRCLWRGQSAEVDIEVSTELSVHETEGAALAWIAGLLTKLGARETWADVRPIEECARCGGDFNTSERHSAIALLVGGGETHEVLPEEVSDVRYAARFCPSCSPAVVAEADAIFRGRE